MRWTNLFDDTEPHLATVLCKRKRKKGNVSSGGITLERSQPKLWTFFSTSGSKLLAYTSSQWFEIWKKKRETWGIVEAKPVGGLASSWYWSRKKKVKKGKRWKRLKRSENASSGKRMGRHQAICFPDTPTRGSSGKRQRTQVFFPFLWVQTLYTSVCVCVDIYFGSRSARKCPGAFLFFFPTYHSNQPVR